MCLIGAPNEKKCLDNPEVTALTIQDVQHLLNVFFFSKAIQLLLPSFRNFLNNHGFYV